VSQTWIDQQTASVVDAAFGHLQVEDPETCAIAGGESVPCYALWVFLVLSYTQDPFPAGMKALQGPAGFAAYPTGVSPYATTVLLAAYGARWASSDREVRFAGDLRNAARGWVMIDLGCADRPEWVVAGLRRAAPTVSVDLPSDSTHPIGGGALGLRDQLEVTRLGVVLNTASDSDQQLTAVLGYAKADDRCYRDGSWHAPPQPSDLPQFGVVPVRR
jgi:hypothetical protein